MPHRGAGGARDDPDGGDRHQGRSDRGAVGCDHRAAPHDRRGARHHAREVRAPRARRSRMTPVPLRTPWRGAVLAVVFALAPAVAWLGPLGFAPLAALAGLLLLPAWARAPSAGP